MCIRDSSSIDQNGVLTIGAAETATTLTVRAASVYDNTKYLSLIHISLTTQIFSCPTSRSAAKARS